MTAPSSNWGRRRPACETTPTPSWHTALLALVAALACWAVLPLLLEYLTADLDPWTVNGMRYVFSAAFWLPLVLRDAHRLPPSGPSSRRALLLASLPVAAALVGSQLCYGATPYFTDATHMNFGCRLSIPFATLFGFWLLPSERPLAKTPLFWLGLLASAAGFLLLFGRTWTPGTATAPALLLMLGYSLFWGLYVVLVRRRLTPWRAHLSYGVVSLLVCAVMLVLMFVLGNPATLLHLPFRLWLILFFGAMLGLAWSHVLYYRALRVTGPIAGESGMLLLPFLTAHLAHLFLGETLLPGQWLSGLLLLLGCTLLLLSRYLLHRSR